MHLSRPVLGRRQGHYLYRFCSCANRSAEQAHPKLVQIAYLLCDLACAYHDLPSLSTLSPMAHTGVKWNEENAASCPYCRTCRFNNMCLNHSSLLIQYYLEDENMPLFFNFLGMPFFHFPPDFINTGVPYLLAACMNICVSA